MSTKAKTGKRPVKKKATPKKQPRVMLPDWLEQPRKQIANWGFSHLFKVFTLSLAAMGLVLIVLNFLQGPRIRHAVIDTQAIVTQPDQRVVLYVNKSIKSLKQTQVSITPAAAFTATGAGETISLQFNERLRYNTVYHVVIHGVEPAYQQHKPSTLTYVFKTADPIFYYLQRNYGIDVSDSGFFDDKKPDNIMQTSLGSHKQHVVFSATRIQDYVVSGDNMIIATINDDQTNDLTLLNLKTKKREQLSLPETGTLTELHASPNHRLAGFSFTSKQQKNGIPVDDSVLYVVDLAADNIISSVDGLDNKPLEVIDWQFAPDGTTILAQDLATNLLLVDAYNTTASQPLGQFSMIDNFSTTGTEIAVSDGFNLVIMNALTHKRTVLPSQPISGQQLYQSSFQLLRNGTGYVEALEGIPSGKQGYEQYILLSRSNKPDIVYQTDYSQNNIWHYSTSPNDQLLLVEEAPSQDNTDDDYPDNGRSHQTHTILIDTTSKKTVRDIAGFDIVWPQ